MTSTAPNLAAVLRADRRPAAARIFRWWLGELGSLVPRRLRAVFDDGAGALVLEPVAGGLRVWQARADASGGREQLGTLREEAGSTAAKLPDAVADALAAEADVVLRLPAARALVREIELPPGGVDDLPGTLAFELDRQTPFRVDQVYVGHSLLARERDGSGRARVTVVRRDELDALLRRATLAGLQPRRVEVDGGDTLALPSLQAGAGSGGIGVPNAVLLALVAGLGLAAALLPLWRLERAAAALEDELAALRPEVAEVLQRSDALNARLAGAERVLARKSAAVPTVLLLDELSRLLPDDTWLGQFNVTEGRVQIEGVSASASALVGLLEQSPLLAGVRFRAPVAADRITGLERFQFEIELARR